MEWIAFAVGLALGVWVGKGMLAKEVYIYQTPPPKELPTDEEGRPIYNPSAGDPRIKKWIDRFYD